VSEERRLLLEYDGISNTHRDAVVLGSIAESAT